MGLHIEDLPEASEAHETGRECGCEAASARSRSVIRCVRVACAWYKKCCSVSDMHLSLTLAKLEVDEAEVGRFSIVGVRAGVGNCFEGISTECL